jgi:HK97 family phage major capsid protein
MKEKLKRMIAEKEAKLAQLRDKVKVSEDVAELRGLSEDIDAVIAELENLKQMYAEADEPAGEGEGAGEGARSGNLNKITETRGGKPDDNAEAEKRAKAFAASGRMDIANSEARAVLVSSGKIATPTEVSGINEKFNSVSSIVDLVKVTNAQGMGAYKVAYEDTDATAIATAEGANYHESDPSFGFVEIKPEKETVISYVSEEVQKQTPLDYEGKVKGSALVALRKRAAAKITAAILASEINEELTIPAIGADTLRKIALSYGGDENVVGGAVLFLNKADLVAFGDVRGSNEKKAVYEITPDASNPNTGIIKDGGLSVKYCINSNATAHATAEAETKTMFYGAPQTAFELALFGDYEVKVSEDYKFNAGLLAIRGAVMLGGDVVQKGGFVVVKHA